MPSPLLALEDAAATRAAVLEGMAVRGWAVESDEPGRLLARYQRSHYVGKVWIAYDEERITFEYADSENLRCWRAGDTCSRIHGVYNRWVSNLARDISNASTRRRAIQAPPGSP